MRCVVTGGAGFIGSHITDRLIGMGHSVLVIDDLSGGFKSNVNHKAEFIQKSINDDLDETFSTFKPDYVYHLAAYAAEGLSHHIPKFNYENNLLGTVNLLNLSYKYKVKHFVFTSSIAVYGHLNKKRFSEKDICVPCDPYGNAKLACENHIRMFYDYYGGPDYTIFRPHNIFGTRQNISDPYRNVVGIFIRKLLLNEALPIFGDGKQTRSFSNIDLVSECISNAPFNSKAKNKVINIGGEKPMTVLVLAKKLSKLINEEPNIKFLPSRKEVRHANADHKLAKLVFKSQYKLHEKDTLDYRLMNMMHYCINNIIPSSTKCPSKIEILDNMPESWRGL